MGMFRDLIDQIRDNRQRTAIEYRSASAGGQIIPWQSNKPQWLPRTIDSYDTAAYRKVALIFRCVQYLANAAGAAPLAVINPESSEADDTHPLRQLIVQPNQGMGESRFMAFIAMNMAVTGFTVIEKERDGAGNVIALWPLRSDWIHPIPINQAPPDWEYRVPGREAIRLSSEDVISIPYADTPDASPTGIGPLASVLREAQISSALTDFLKVFMDRGALPLYAIIPQDEGVAAAQWNKPETRQAFLDKFKQRYMGLGNAAVEPLPLMGVKDVKQIGLDFNQLAYTDLNDLQDANICTAFGIPPILVGAQVGLDQATYSNYGQARTSFYEDTMQYLWARIDDAFTRHLLPEFEWRPGWQIVFDTSEIPALQDDRNDASSRAVAEFQAGMISRHVAQVEAGHDPHGADEFLIPFNMLPVANTANVRRVRGRAMIDRRHEIDVAVRRIQMHALPDHNPKAPAYVFREGRRYINLYHFTPEEREQRAATVDTARQTFLGLADILEPRLASFFTEQADRIVEGLALRSDGPPEQRFAESIDWAGENDLLRQIFAAWWEEVSQSALTSAEALLGTEITWSVVNPYLATLDGILAQRVVGVNETTRQAIEDKATAMLGEGTTLPDLADAVSELVTETYQGRATTIARTESMFAYGTASSEVYAASGVVQRVVLHDNPKHDTDPGSDGLTCAERNGLVVLVADVGRHLNAEHPNGTLAISPVVTPLTGE